MMLLTTTYNPFNDSDGVWIEGRPLMSRYAPCLWSERAWSAAWRSGLCPCPPRAAGRWSSPPSNRWGASGRSGPRPSEPLEREDAVISQSDYTTWVHLAAVLMCRLFVRQHFFTILFRLYFYMRISLFIPFKDKYLFIIATYIIVYYSILLL